MGVHQYSQCLPDRRSLGCTLIVPAQIARTMMASPNSGQFAEPGSARLKQMIATQMTIPKASRRPHATGVDFRDSGCDSNKFTDRYRHMQGEAEATSVHCSLSQSRSCLPRHSPIQSAVAQGTLSGLQAPYSADAEPRGAAITTHRHCAPAGPQTASLRP